MKCIEIEEAVARMFGVRQNMIVPNISWGLGIHECDLLVVRPTGFAVEVEIKVSRSDLKKDAEKKHGHISDKIKQLYFAVPEKLVDDAMQYAPVHAGIIAVSNKYPRDTFGWSAYWNKATIVHPAVTNKLARPLTDSECAQVARLGCMRIWGLKEKLIMAVKT